MELSDKVPEAAQRVVGAMALPLVAAAARAHPDDLPAVEAHANALWMTGQRPEALAIFEGVLKERPRRETALYAAAAVAMELRRWDLAIGYWERAVQANPYRWRYRAGLAAAHAANEQWNQALFAADQALKLNPVDVDTRQVVARGLLALGKPALARQELERLVALRPQDAKQLRAWFADLERRGR
jgi:tetratricopeptide (TPR) repeat protein